MAPPDDSPDLDASADPPGDAPRPDGSGPDAALDGDSQPATSPGYGPGDPASSNDGDRFLIVGIGASAGGLKAYREFFEALPAEPGMAFVLVQHLSPDHESALAELIQVRSKLSVNQVTDHPTVRPNCVYVIPPAKRLELVDGHLQLVELQKDRGKPTAIDHFFRSLADQVGPRAVAVVLSGTGSDGSIGLKAVKERAGLTLAQEPSDADYDGMPKSAIATGLVDIVGTAAELARSLVAVREAEGTLDMPGPDEPVDQDDEEVLGSIFRHLRRRTGHDFVHYKRSTILRRLARRLQVVGASSLVGYAEVFKERPEETQALLRDFLISVTQFFRDPEAFEELEDRVIPQLFGGSGQVRVWVPGCATGEEAYSVAMLLCEHARTLDEPPDIQVFATDIDDDALLHAREGIYSEAVAADLTEDRRLRYFEPVPGGVRVKAALRECVLFARHNLIADPPFSRLDLITCRNVLIYFTREIQERAFASFHYALRSDGYLFLGSSEAPNAVTNGFAEVDKRARIYRRRDVPLTRGRTAFLAGRAGIPDTPTTPKPTEDARGGLVNRYQEWTLATYAPPRLLIDDGYDVTHVFGRAGDYLRDREGPVTQNVVDKVLSAFRIDLRTALYRAFSKGETVDTPFRRVEVGDEARHVRLHVGPVGGAAREDGMAEVVFIELDPASVERLRTAEPAPSGDEPPVVARLEDELTSTKARLQTTIEEQETSNEELRASNEELQSINEELQSTTEELETSREELQSINEELTTVNHELRVKVDELTRANADLQNLMGSMEVATVFLDRALRLRRFTPRAADLFNVLPADLGRPFDHVSHRVEHDDLQAVARRVIDDLQPATETVRSGDETFLLRVTPYRTLDDRIDGVVMTFSAVTEVEAARSLAATRAEQQAVVARLGEHALEGASLDALFAEATGAARDVFGADASKVLRYVPEAGHLELIAGEGWREGAVGTAVVPHHVGSQAGFTLQQGQPVVVPDLGQEDRFEAPDLLTDHGLRSGISVAISTSTEGRPFGVFAVHSKEPRAFSEDDGRFMQSIANILADAVELDRQRATIREQLREIEAVYDTAPVGLAFLDETLRYRRVNRRLADINGVPVEEHIGKRTGEVIPEMANKVEPILDQIMQTGQPVEDVEIEGSAPTDPDDPRVWLCSYVPSLDDDGRPLGVSMVVRDITDRKRTERELAETAARLRLAMDAPGLGSYNVDLVEGTVVYDPKAQELLGLSAHVPLSDAHALNHPDDDAEVQAALRDATDPEVDDDSFVSVHRIVRGDGTVLWIAARGVVVFEGEGDDRRADRLIGVMLDVSELKRVQEALRRQLAETGAYLDAVPVGIAVFDRDGRYARLNDRMMEIIGASASELIGTHPRDLLPPGHVDANEPLLRHVLATGEAMRDVEMRLTLPSDPGGELSDWLVSVVPLTEGGETTGAALVAQDVTALKQAQAGLEALASELEERVVLRTAEVRKLVGDLSTAERRERARLAQILHDDLQQILYAAQFKLESLRKAAPTATDLIDSADDLLDQAIHTTRTLTVDLRPPVLEGDGLDKTVEWLAHRMEEAYGLVTTVEASESVEVGRTVQVLIYQVVRELLFNIVKHAETQAATVSVDQDEGRVRIVVADLGVGFTEAEVNPESLGLSSARERIRLVGGTMDVESRPNEGTRVTIMCPTRL